ncbi:MAG TPA: helix-turn-helix domain-containing GNAT family N-acetyltransferase [Polyangiaceae bacterium]
MDDATRERIAAVRAFNRFWTTRIGVLDATHLGTPFSLTEARALFELAQREATEVAELRRRLGLDAGYLSRLLAEFRDRGLLSTGVSKADARKQVARLTAKGKRAAGELDGRAVEHVARLLEPLAEREQREMVAALETATRLLEREPAKDGAPVLRAPGPGDYGWMVERHGAIYAGEYGWDERFEGLVASIVAEHVAARDPRTAAWIAWASGERAGCILCAKKNERTAQLRILLVEPRFRGRGLGGLLVDECLRFARGAGYGKMVLWTNDVLTDARKLYERAGFSRVATKKHSDFGVALTGETWEKKLSSTSSRAASRSLRSPSR